MKRFLGARGLVLAGMIAAFASFAPATAMADTTVVNGDFESGTLEGWETWSDTEDPGGWFPYSGDSVESPEGFETSVEPPPQGEYAAATAEDGPGTHILYQDIDVEPGGGHLLTMYLYYVADAGIAVPEPDSLYWDLEGVGPNEQYRVDLMSPGADIESLAPEDILETVFATEEGDPEQMAPRMFEVDLTPYIGQTVRLRLAEVDNQDTFNAGVDAVRFGLPSPPPPDETPSPPAPHPLTSPPASTTPAPALPSNAFKVGRAKLNPRKGTAKLPVTPSGPGALSLRAAPLHQEAHGHSWHFKPLVKTFSSASSGAGTVPLTVRPTKAARKLLGKIHKLRVGVDITFTPTGGSARVKKRTLTLRLRPKRKHHSHHRRR